MFAGRNRLGNVRLGSAGNHGHPACGRRANDLHNPPPFFGRNPDELPRGAVGIEPVQTLLDEPIQIAGDGTSLSTDVLEFLSERRLVMRAVHAF